MALSSGRDGSMLSEINVTPLVDVMLVLLIIFMVTAPMMMQGVDVDLPEVTSQPLSAQEEALIVSITMDGQVFISDYEVSVDDLGAKLQKILEGRESRQVFMNGDKTVPYGVVVRVMSEIRAAGIENLGLVTDPEVQDSGALSKETEAAR